MISLQNVSVVFNKGKAGEIAALKELNLEILPQDFLVVVGANGSGKSTLLNSIAGATIPTSGKIRFSDKDVTKLPEFARSQWVARVFQNPFSGTASNLTILENFRLASTRTSAKMLTNGISANFIKEVRSRIASLEMGLEDKIHQPIGSLSGGQRQALTLLMAVMDKCEVLLLDEPTSALDPRSADLVMKTAEKIISDYKLTAILITHNLREAFSFGNRIVQMADGKLIRDLGFDAKTSLNAEDLYKWF